MHISKTLIEVLNDSFARTLERRHNKPSKTIKWAEMTKGEQTIQLELVAMKNKAKGKI
jgi:hypothetical protein|tara:strand:- start:92 stop:265 length:174 start_codon:yes stop_codon:yes gene_type:complete